MKLRMLVAGGCHVAGYPIGEEYSFVNVAKHILAARKVEAQTITMGRTPVTHATRLAEAIETHRPDVLVLQLGNYETTATFKQYFRRVLGLTKKVDSNVSTLAADAEFPGEVKWRLKCRVKLWMDLLLRHQLVQVPAVARLLAMTFDHVALTRVPHVIVLSPLPCADPLYMRYRRELAGLFERESAARNFTYVDLLETPGEAKFFADATHLNRKGQHWVGQAVARAVFTAIGTGPAEDTEIARSGKWATRVEALQ